MVIVGFLFFKRRVPEFQGLYKATLWVFLGCATAHVVILSQLGLTMPTLSAQWSAITSAGMAKVGTWMWLLKQFAYLEFNFGQINIALFVMLLIYVVGVRLFWGNILFFGSSVVLFAGLVLIVLFRSYSFSHHHAQVYLALSYVLLMGGVLINVKQKIWLGRHLQFLGISIVIPVLLLTGYNAYIAQDALSSSAFGVPGDMNIIKSMDKQIVYAPKASGPISWWRTSVVSLYTDKFYKGASRSLRPIAGTAVTRLNPKTQVIVVNNSADRSMAIRFFQKKFKVRELRVYRRSPNFTYYRFSL